MRTTYQPARKYMLALFVFNAIAFVFLSSLGIALLLVGDAQDRFLYIMVAGFSVFTVLEQIALAINEYRGLKNL